MLTSSSSVRTALFWIVAGIMSSTAAYTLITFDVDGTLLYSPHKQHSSSTSTASGGAVDVDQQRPTAHSRAFSHAVGHVLGDNNNKNDDMDGTKPCSIAPVHTLLPREHVAGSTDGLILLRLARAALHMEPLVVLPQLDALMHSMDTYMATLGDAEIACDIQPLPGVLDTLQLLASNCLREDNNHPHSSKVLCGIVTGNVEGVARRKMRATGITATGALAPAAADQLERLWSLDKNNNDNDTDHGTAFLGGFGSDFCSGDIDNMERNHLDRAEQISICVNRCRTLQQFAPNSSLRVVHVGDAPADVWAAKAYARQQQAVSNDPDHVVVNIGMVAVATGKYSVQELQEAAGDNVAGQWECVVLEKGMSDPHAFLRACGVDI